MIPILTSPRQESAEAKAALSEGMFLTCEFSYPVRFTSPANLSEKITEEIREDWQGHRVVIGDVELMFSRYQSEGFFRLDEIYTYTNPKLWRECALPAPPENTPAVYFNLEAEVEAGGVTSIKSEHDIWHDKLSNRLQIRFAPLTERVKWTACADHQFALLGPGRELLALQFERIVVGKTEYAHPDRRRGGRWANLWAALLARWR